MSARELIEQVKALPLDEQESFFSAIHKLEEEQGCSVDSITPNARKQFTPWPNIRERQRLVFGDTVFPTNIVLDTREEEEH